MGEQRPHGNVGPGTELDGFVIEEVAGRGGMGVVYRARQRQPERVVALKVIAVDLAQDDAFRARFQRESSIAAQIEHPNVIPVYAVGEADGVLYLAMRFVDGTDLRSLLAQHGRLTPERAAAIVDAVGSALDAAHAHGLVHRDVKPANILIASVGGRDHVYLSDFGLSRHIEGSAGLTGTGAFLGTIDYVAPEQARGERVDARTDVYSLGCVLFQALTGTVPYPLDNDLAKLYAHDQQAPPSALERAPDLPPEFENVLLRAMAKAPDDRYLSAGDLGRAALAAAAGSSLSRAERSVAVAAAAPAGASEVAAAASPSTPAAPSAAAPGSQPSGGGAAAAAPPARSRGRLGIVAAAVAAAAAIVVVVVVLSSGSGGSSGGGTTSSASQTTAPSTTTTSASSPASGQAPTSAPQQKFGGTSFESAGGAVRCRFAAPTLTCRNLSGTTAKLTKSGHATFSQTSDPLPRGANLLKSKGVWEGGNIDCFPFPNGAVSCGAFNGHGFHMNRDAQSGGANAY